MYHNGVLAFIGAAAYVGLATNHTIGISQKPAPFVSSYLNEVIIDEVAFFDAPVDPLQIYNSGVPLEYGERLRWSDCILRSGEACWGYYTE